MASPSCFSDAVIISACIQPVKAENRAGKRGGSVVRYAQTDKKEGVILLYLGLLLLAGILQGVMVSLNGQMGNYFSLFGICFFVHAIALVLLLAYLLAKRQTLRFAGAPWYVYLVGVMGIAIVASSSWCTLHVGASAFMALSTAGQLVSSALIDRFGLFGMRAGAAGRASGRSELREGCKMIYYLTALINGFFNSVNRMTNVRAGKLFGTANGALINYVEATVLSLLLMLVLKNGKELSWGYIVSVPWWVYLGSICGLLAQLLQIVGTLRSNTLVSSILMLAGNLGMSLTLDYVFYGTFSLLRAAGIFLILAGMALVEKEKTAEAQTAAEEK